MEKTVCIPKFRLRVHISYDVPLYAMDYLLVLLISGIIGCPVSYRSVRGQLPFAPLAFPLLMSFQWIAVIVHQLYWIQFDSVRGQRVVSPPWP